MARATIRDLAAAAGVSVSTVNRVLAGADNVRGPTTDLVKATAERIGFYGLGVIRSNITAQRPKLRLGFLLHQPGRLFYQMVGSALSSSAGEVKACEVETTILFAEDLSPQNLAAKILELGASCDAIGVVAAVHPLVALAIEQVEQNGVHVFGLISQLSSTGSVNYVGLDNWKVGRTSAWAMEHMCKAPGKIGILVGNHRYRCQEMNESGFRSYFREHAPAFTLLEPLSTFETSAVAEEMTEQLLNQNPDLVGLYISGGGIAGALDAIRTCKRSGTMITIGYELMDNTRAALLDSTLTMVIAHPLVRLASETISAMVTACQNPNDRRKQTIILPFDIFTRENV